MAKSSRRFNKSEEFTFIDRIVAFRFRQALRILQNGILGSILILLLDHCTESHCACVCLECEGFTWVRKSDYLNNELVTCLSFSKL